MITGAMPSSVAPPGRSPREPARVGDLVRFYLGTHKDSWLRDAGVPLFVSRRTLAERRTLPQAAAPWALDSGGFTELQLHGRWTIEPRAYAAEVRRFRDEIGLLDWAAPQDYMCEPIVIAGGRAGGITFAGTKLSVAEHQGRTIQNLLELRSIAPDLPFAPVLQGWCAGDYLDHVEAYARAGVDLTREPIVGVGTVCRRQDTLTATWILADLAALGLRLHAFGYKVGGLQAAAHYLASADSMAWSSHWRHRLIDGHDKPGPGRRNGHGNCANCEVAAKLWREDLLARLVEPLSATQMSLLARRAS